MDVLCVLLDTDGVGHGNANAPFRSARDNKRGGVARVARGAVLFVSELIFYMLRVGAQQ